jgi:endoribonuclease Dicer
MKIQMRYVVTQSELGPYAGELYLFIVMQHLINQFSAETEDDQLYIDAQPQLPWGSDGDLPQARAILDDFSPFFEGSPGLGESHMTVLPEWYSPKVHALAEILLEHYTPTFQGIVFVEQRQIAICLARLLPLLPSLKGVIRCADLVGQGGPPDTLRAMGTQSQAAIVRSFREKHINLRERDAFSSVLRFHSSIFKSSRHL